MANEKRVSGLILEHFLTTALLLASEIAIDRGVAYAGNHFSVSPDLVYACDLITKWSAIATFGVLGVGWPLLLAVVWGKRIAGLLVASEKKND